MIKPDLIDRMFAENGEIEAPPQLSPAGFINFNEGYTVDYELRLNSNNPQAKAVERKAMNYMFNALTKNAKAWQAAGLPPWYQDMPGGYEKGARVLFEVDNELRPFRSLINQNLSTPNSSPASWEYEQGTAELIANIPMPAGGAGGAGSFIITTGGAQFQPSTLSRGTYIFATDAAAQATTGLPIDAHNDTITTRLAGTLEIAQWPTPSSRICRYTDRRGIVYILPSGSTSWVQQINYEIMQAGKANYAYATAVNGDVNVLAATLSPAPIAIGEGFRVLLQVSAQFNTGPVTLNINGTGALEVRGNEGSVLSGGEIGSGLPAEFVWRAGRWYMISPGYRQRGAPALSDGQLPNWGQVQERVRVNPSLCGAIQAFAHANTGPEWLRCDGAAYSRATYADLFAAIGTTYGAGNGTTTFNVPDTRGVFLRDTDNRSQAQGKRDPDGPRVLGSIQTSQNLSHSHTGAAASNGAHTHAVSTVTAGAHTHTATTNPDGGHNHTISGSTSNAGVHTHTASGSAASNGDHTHTISTNSAGSHTHTVSGSAASAGAHTHTVSGNTSSAGSHQHPLLNQASSGSSLPSQRALGTEITRSGFNINDNVTDNLLIQAEGAHTHTVSGNANSSGAHTHTVSGTAAAAGDHTHTGAAASAGAHTHTVSVGVANAGGHTHDVTGATTSVGAHTHNLTTASAGDHTHTGTAASAGAHTHTIQTDLTGITESRPINFAINYFIHI